MKKQAMATTRLPEVSPLRLQQPLPSLLRLSPLLQLPLSFLLRRRLPRQRDSYRPPPLQRGGSCDSTRSIWKVALYAKVNDRTARADSARIPCPS